MTTLSRVDSAFVATLMSVGLVNIGAGQQASVPTTPVDPPAMVGSMAPNLTSKGDMALLSWLEPVGEPDHDAEYRLRFARFERGEWSEARTIVEGVEFFANWADVPALAIAADDTLLAGWLEKSGPGTFAYDVRLARSRDDGVTWTHLGPAHNDGVQSEHGFMSFVPEADAVRAFWLDGRNMESTDDAGDDGHGAGAMTIRSALIGDRVRDGLQLDQRVCECCPTAATMTSLGPVVVYRNRSPVEERDIWIVRYDGMEWTSPRPVHEDGWVIPGCPVNDPAIVARDARVAVAWYTAAENEEKILLAFSEDDGASFAAPIIIDDTRPVGRTALVLDESGDVIVSWLDSQVPDGALRARRVDWNGSTGPIVTLAPATTARASGSPRLVRLNRTILLAWTEPLPAMNVRALAFDASSLPAATSTSPED